MICRAYLLITVIAATYHEDVEQSVEDLSNSEGIQLESVDADAEDEQVQSEGLRWRTTTTCKPTKRTTTTCKPHHTTTTCKPHHTTTTCKPTEHPWKKEYCQKLCDKTESCREDPHAHGSYCKHGDHPPVCFGLYHDKHGGYCFQPNDPHCDEYRPVRCYKY